MINAKMFLDELKRKGVLFFSGVPCSYMTSLTNVIIENDDIDYVAAANEGEAVAIAAGAEMAGKPACILLQNSGLGNAVNPLTSLTNTFQIPLLIIVSLRGEPDGPPDEPQHELMGRITIQMLELMGIRWSYFPTTNDEIESALEVASDHIKQHKQSFAFVMKKGSVNPASLKLPGLAKPPPAYSAALWQDEAQVSRTTMLETILRSTRDDDVIVASTGYIGRELYALSDRQNQFYMVGSMGCASSVGLGIALNKPGNRVIVLDGDGAILMRLSALATIGYEKPKNFIHILLDNHIHESTGGQATISHSVAFSSIARACGYGRAENIVSPSTLEDFLSDSGHLPSFAHTRITTGFPTNLPRPSIKPPDVADRLRKFLATPRASVA